MANEIIKRNTERLQAARQCVAGHKSDLHLKDEQIDQLVSDWMTFEDNFDSQGETHPWKLKYLVALAFCKGWESASDRR